MWIGLALVLTFDFIVSLVDLISGNKSRYDYGLKHVLNIADILIMTFEIIFVVAILYVYL